jgi:MFS family permease
LCTVDKYGVKPAAALGFLFQSLPLFLLRFPKAGGTPEIVKFSVLIALCGIGMSMVSAPSIVEASCVTELYHKHNPEYFGKEGPYAQLYAINSVFFCLGLTFGPLISGGLRDAIGYGNMNAVMAGLCLFTSALSFVYLGGRPRILGGR